MSGKTPKRKRAKTIDSPSVKSSDDVPYEHGASLEDFVQFGARLSVELLNEGNLVIGRFFAFVTRAEIFESLSVGLIVGGSIVIPHLRRAVDRWSELERLAQ